MSSDSQLSEDSLREILSILGHPRQRRILSLLQEWSHPITQRDLAVQLAARHGDKPPSEVTDEERQRIEIGLYHRDLPKLESTGLIDRQASLIVATEEVSELPQL